MLVIRPPKWFVRELMKACASGFLYMVLTHGCLAVQGDYSQIHTPKRHVLIVADGAYENIPPVPSSTADLTGVEQKFRALGFEDIDSHANVPSVQAFNPVYQSFLNRIEIGDLAVVYFSGHGLAFGGDNYFLLSGIKSNATQNDLEDYAVSSGQVEVSLAARHPGLILVLLDACRALPSDFRVASDGTSYAPQDSAVEMPDVPPPASASAPEAASYVLTAYNDPSDPPLAIKQTNVMVGYAAHQGYSAEGSTDTQAMSLYTKALGDHILQKDADFIVEHRDVETDVSMAARKLGVDQNPGLDMWSKTALFLNPSARLAQDDEEAWQAASASSDYSDMERFSLSHSLSPHWIASLQWLADNENNQHPTAAYTMVSPISPERAWRSDDASRVAILASNGSVAFPRSINLSGAPALANASDTMLGLVPSGTAPAASKPSGGCGSAAASGTGVAAVIGAIQLHAEIVPTRPVTLRDAPDCNAGVVATVPARVPLNPVAVANAPKAKGWLAVQLADRVGFLNMQPATPTKTVELGHSLQEVMLPVRPRALPDLVDGQPLLNAIAGLQKAGNHITWISLASAAPEVGTSFERAREESFRAGRLADAMYLLRRQHFDMTRVTTVQSVSDFTGSGVRARIFGY